jgi:fermentation-respiration switch protein FrsA (DUF1100 family)
MISRPKPGRSNKRNTLLRLLRFSLIVTVILAAAGFFALRQYEAAVTFHPVRYIEGPGWELPSGANDVWFATADGKHLHGWFFKTAQTTARGTIIYFHGNSGNVTNVGWIGSAFASRGFDVLLMDYRGYGRSEGEVTDEGGINADADAGYDYLVKERGVNPERLVLIGQSLGTTAAADLASRRACRALVLESGPSSAGDMARVMLPWAPQWLSSLAKNRFESARKLANVHCPVLITHGSNDNQIPVEQGRALYDAANETRQLIIVQGAGHDIAGFAGDRYLDSVAGFIRETFDAQR